MPTATLSRHAAPNPLPAWAAVLVALVVGAASAAVILWRAQHDARPSDVDQLWFAARALLAGHDPYALIGPGRAFDWEWPLYYPLPAAVLFLPFAPFPVIVARLALGAVAGAGLAYLVARYDWRWLVIFASKAYYLNVWYVQWGAVLMLPLFLPWLGVLFAAKPTNGAAMLAAFRDWRAVRVAIVAALVPVVIAFALHPAWLARWLGVMQSAEHFRPFVLMPGGFLLVLAALRWRDWQGRLLLGLAVIPQTLLQYGALPLLLVPRQRWGSVVLVACTFLPGVLVVRAPFGVMMQDATARGDFATVTSIVGGVTLATVYLPALAFVLWDSRRAAHQPLAKKSYTSPRCVESSVKG